MIDAIPGDQHMLKNRTDIPEFLVGNFADVSKRMRSLARKAMKSGSWATVLEGAGGIPLESIPLKITTSHAFNRGMTLNEDRVVVSTVMEAMFSAGKAITERNHDRAIWYERQMQLVDEGLDYFWFAMSFLAGDFIDLNPMERPDSRGSPLARRLLVKLLNWAELLDEYRGRCVHWSGMKKEDYGFDSFFHLFHQIVPEGALPNFNGFEFVRLTWVQRRRFLAPWLSSEI